MMVPAKAAIETAKKYAPKASMRSSADFGIEQAEKLLNEGRDDLAKMWALRSLSYSVGVFSPVYRAAEG